MSAKRIHRQLSLESLETRTLLAGAGDLFGLNADLELARTAITGSGDFAANFSTNWGNKQLVITGTSATSLTIDMDRLPEFITNLKISSFASVTVLGTDDVENLILTDIGSFKADGLDVNASVHAKNVSALTLDSIGRTAVLEGRTMDLSVRLLDETMVFTDFDTLKLTSTSEKLFLISENDSQSIQLTYRPDSIQLAGVPSTSLEIRLPGSTPPAIPGTGNPTPGGGNGSGTDVDPLPDNGVDPGTDPDSGEPTTPTTPDEVFVFNFPADERMRQFIADLRQFLRAAAEDPRQSGAQFVDFSLIGSQPTILALESGQAAAAAVRANALVAQNEMLADEIALIAGEATDHLAISAQFVADSWGSAGNALVLPQTALASAPTLDLGYSLELANNEQPVAPAATPLSVPSKNDSQGQLAESPISEIIESVRALGGYLVDRVSAELTPGQQSLVLLVDPKPARGGTGNRNSALEIFANARGSSKSELLSS